jgi:hypothetical protein
MSDLDLDFEEFIKLMKITALNLKVLNSAQKEMRWQFGEPQEFLDFSAELDKAASWVSSNC